MPPKFDKYRYYERSVQTPEVHVEQFDEFYKELNPGREARVLREDFCGTFKISCHWVKHHPEHRAIGLDLDPEPLEYGRKVHRAKLTSHQKKRLTILQKNVLSVTKPAADIIAACNFSFCIFKDRKTLLDYFRFGLRSLSKGGLMLLEQAGGPGMIAPVRERTPHYDRKTKKRLYSYVWHQRSFDPITHDAKYSIHFEFADGRKYHDVFTYDWRLWTIPEIKDAMLDAGFKDVHVYWETTHRGKGTGEYRLTKNADNAFSWIAYIIGQK